MKWKRKGSNCVGILSDQGEAVTASNLSEYTIKAHEVCKPVVKMAHRTGLRH